MGTVELDSVVVGSMASVELMPTPSTTQCQQDEPMTDAVVASASALEMLAASVASGLADSADSASRASGASSEESAEASQAVGPQGVPVAPAGVTAIVPFVAAQVWLGWGPGRGNGAGDGRYVHNI